MLQFIVCAIVHVFQITKVSETSTESTETVAGRSKQGWESVLWRGARNRTQIYGTVWTFLSTGKLFFCLL